MRDPFRILNLAKSPDESVVKCVCIKLGKKVLRDFDVIR